MMKHSMELAMGLCMLLLVSMISQHMKSFLTEGTAVSGEIISKETEAEIDLQTEPKSFVVVLDAGHGGVDCGKVGVNGSLEKDINLSIVQYLKSYLEASDVKVILTREDGNGLYSESDSNRKRADMQKRCEIIEKANPDIVVSIHQNSYQTENVSGAQVFYYKGSAKGEMLAQAVQDRFDYVLGEENTRGIKANTDYYLLLHVASPIVIVECGFLSNREEAEQLVTEEYQQKVAWTIHMGIMEYLNESSAER